MKPTKTTVKHEKIDENELFKSPNTLVVSVVSAGVLGGSGGIVAERAVNAIDSLKDYSLTGGLIVATLITVPVAIRLYRGPKS